MANINWYTEFKAIVEANSATATVILASDTNADRLSNEIDSSETPFVIFDNTITGSGALGDQVPIINQPFKVYFLDLDEFDSLDDNETSYDISFSMRELAMDCFVQLVALLDLEVDIAVNFNIQDIRVRFSSIMSGVLLTFTLPIPFQARYCYEEEGD